MSLPSSQRSPALVYQFLHFVWYTLLPAVPVALWWAAGLVVFSFLNLLLKQEIWPNTPQAEPMLATMLGGCLLAAPWLLAATSRRITNSLTSWWWRGFWRLVTIGFYLAAVLAMVVAFIFSVISLVSL